MSVVACNSYMLLVHTCRKIIMKLCFNKIFLNKSHWSFVESCILCYMYSIPEHSATYLMHTLSELIHMGNHMGHSLRVCCYTVPVNLTTGLMHTLSELIHMGNHMGHSLRVCYYTVPVNLTTGLMHTLSELNLTGHSLTACYTFIDSLLVYQNTYMHNPSYNCWGMSMVVLLLSIPVCCSKLLSKINIVVSF
jgi:hypothetical protein